MLLVLSVAMLVGSSWPARTHDRAFWRGIIQANYAIPAGSSADALSDELSDLLGNPDPELRDDIAYTLLAQWLAIAPRISDAQARRLVDRWVANLSPGEARDANAVLLRSFSALSLAAAIARENATPYLGEERYRAVLDAALRYFDTERDPRGFDATLGWVHATAHTADLLKFLARTAYLQPADQSRIFQAIGKRVSAADVWVSGEDERIARVVLSLVLRADAQWDAYAALVKDVGAMSEFPERPTPRTLARRQNARHLLTSLYAVLATADQTAAISRARQEVARALKSQ